MRALDSLIELARLYNDDDEMAEAATRLSATDAGILEARDAKVLRQAGMAQTAKRHPEAPGHRSGARRSEWCFSGRGAVLLRKTMVQLG